MARGVIYPVHVAARAGRDQEIGDRVLRSLVESLLAQVVRLQEDVAVLRAENAALKEEIARLKGLPPRPKLKPSGMDKAANAALSPQPSGKSMRNAAGAPSATAW